MTDEGPKSAFELAMERLRRQDQEAGVAPHALSDDQKAEIAEIRRVYAAKIAEVEILHKSKLATVWDFEERAKLEEAYRRDLERLKDERERKIEQIRRGS